MDMMRGALLLKSKDIKVRDLVRPEVKPDSVILKVAVVGICGTDLHQYRNGESGGPNPEGHEYVGTVVEVGANVTRLRIGQRVVVDPFLCSSCGVCSYCDRGLTFHCKNRLRLDGVGGFGQYVSADAKGCFLLPDGIDDNLGALVEPLAVATHAVRMLAIKPGMSGVIIGAGSVGLFALAASLFAGAKDVFVLAKYPTQQAIAKKLGASWVLSPDDGLAEALIKEKYPDGVDFVIEAVGGTASTLERACDFLRPAGAISILGTFDKGFRGLEILPALLKEVKVSFSNCYGMSNGRHDFEVAIENLTERGQSLRCLVTHELPLESIAEAFQIAADKTQGSIKVQVRMPLNSAAKKVIAYLDFKAHGESTSVGKIDGLYAAEAWGSWSNGRTLQIEFTDALPDRFFVHLTGHAFGSNANGEFSASIGGASLPFKLTQQLGQNVFLDFCNPTNSNKFIINIPNPESPAALGINSDSRNLGLGLVAINFYE